MNQTIEKSTHEMHQDKPMSMPNQFYGEPMSMKDMSKVSAVVGVIKNQILVCEDELKAAKLRFADSSLDDDNWQGKYDRKVDCKMLEAQISILMKMEREIENMFQPSDLMSA